MKTQIREKCPYCPPFKPESLSINTRSGLFNCFRCNFSGKMKGRFAPRNLTSDSHTVVENLPWPEGFDYLTGSKDNAFKRVALKYLAQREITEGQMSKYFIGYCNSGRYERRVVVPIMRGGELIYFVARSFDRKEPRKYLNPPVPKGDILFKTFIGKAHTAVVVEGIFDALRVERAHPDVIALLSKKASKGQMAEIRKSASRVIVLLDRDATKDAIKLGEKIGYYMPTIRLYLRKGDPGSQSIENLKMLLGRVT